MGAVGGARAAEPLEALKGFRGGVNLVYLFADSPGCFAGTGLTGAGMQVGKPARRVLQKDSRQTIVAGLKCWVCRLKESRKMY